MEPQVENKTEEQKPVEQQNTQQEAPKQESIEEINWKKFRDQRESERRLAKENEEKAAKAKAEADALKAAMEALLSKPAQQDPTEETEEDRIAKLVDKRVAEAEQRREAKKAEEEKKQLPQKLSTTYKDYYDVCSEENLTYLEYHHPEVARSLKERPDSFDKWADVYTAIKRYIPNVNSKKEEAKIEKNLSKPQSLSTSGAGSTGDTAPMKLDDKRKADNWARMQRRLKGIA